MPIITTWIPIIKDVVTILTLIVGAYVALTGLSTWREQLIMQTEYNLARRVLTTIYKLRNAIEKARVPAGFWEDADINPKATREFYKDRIAEVDNAEASLDVELLEFEAVWEDEQGFQAGLLKLKAARILLDLEYQQYFSTDNEKTKENEKSYTAIFSAPMGEDKFSNNLKKAVEQIEGVLQPKLRLQKRKPEKKKFGRR